MARRPLSLDMPCMISRPAISLLKNKHEQHSLHYSSHFYTSLNTLHKQSEWKRDDGAATEIWKRRILNFKLYVRVCIKWIISSVQIGVRNTIDSDHKMTCNINGCKPSRQYRLDRTPWVESQNPSTYLSKWNSMYGKNPRIRTSATKNLQPKVWGFSGMTIFS